MPRPLSEKREEMIDFILRNARKETVSGIETVSTERLGNDVLVHMPAGKKNIYVKTISRQQDSPYEFEQNPKNFDNEREKLRAINLTIADYVKYFKTEACKNTLGGEYVPAFVLLGSEVDRKQVTDQRTSNLVNHGYFLKRVTKDNPHMNLIKMDPLELTLMYWHRLEKGKPPKKTQKRKQHMPGLTYFDPEYQEIVFAHFADKKNVPDYKRTECPVCYKKNGEADHTRCRENLTYKRDYASPRDEALYHKYWERQKTRTDIDREKEKGKVQGLEFRMMSVDTGILKLDYKDCEIAVIK